MATINILGEDFIMVTDDLYIKGWAEVKDGRTPPPSGYLRIAAATLALEQWGQSVYEVPSFINVAALAVRTYGRLVAGPLLRVSLIRSWWPVVEGLFSESA